MSDNNHLAVPSSPPNAPPRPESSGSAGASRARSGSLRSHKSSSTTENVQPQSQNYDRRPSIRIRRLSSVQPPVNEVIGSGSGVRRNRSTSEPQRPHLAVVTEAAPPRPATRQSRMPGLEEETFSPTTGNVQDSIEPLPGPAVELGGSPAAVQRPTRLRRARTNIAQRFQSNDQEADEYEAGLVDLLDTVGMWDSNWHGRAWG
jgi:hypothetical protein